MPSRRGMFSLARMRKLECTDSEAFASSFFRDQFAMFFAAFRIFRLKYGWSAAVIPRSNIVLFLSDIQQLIIIVLQYWVYM